MKNERGLASLGLLCIVVLALVLMREKYLEGPKAFNEHMRRIHKSKPMSPIPVQQSRVKLPKALQAHSKEYIDRRVEEELAKLYARTGTSNITVHQQAEIISRVAREVPVPTRAQMEEIYAQMLANRD